MCIAAKNMYAMKPREQNPNLSLNEHFLLACENANVALARELLAEGADRNARNASGESALHLAVKSGDARVVEYTVRDLGLSTQAADSFGRTPLHWAAQQGNMQIVEVLLLAQADLDARDDLGIDPQVYAEKSGHSDIVKVFNLVRAARR